MGCRGRCRSSGLRGAWLRRGRSLLLGLGLGLCLACSSGETDRRPGPGGGGSDAGPDIPPNDYAGARFFVPRIVPDDGTNAIWNAKQRAALLWFGQVDQRNDYVDCRLGTSPELLMIHCAVFDREIYDDATDDGLEAWDSLRLLIDPDGRAIDAPPGEHALRIDAQAHRQGSERTVVYHAVAGAWAAGADVVGGDPADGASAISVVKGYRGEDRDQSRGWHVTFYLRWAALGLGGPPASPDDVMALGLQAFDRDSADGSLHGDPQSWPTASLDPVDRTTWGRVELLEQHFLSWDESGATTGHGAPAYAIGYVPPSYQAGTEHTVTIREGLDGDAVEGRAVGASEILCSGDDAYDFGNGPASWGGNTVANYFHVQNEEDYADWPCFAKIYLKFPLTKLPPSAIVVSARLVLHHKEPTSAGTDGERSLLQAYAVGDELRDGTTPWTAANLSWNDAPLPHENLAGFWGDRTGNAETGWDALPEWSWDVSYASGELQAGGAASFALYSADSEYNTGKQFVTSQDFPDWGDPSQRPTLELTIADPAGQ
jgi:hypothetical protein